MVQTRLALNSIRVSQLIYLITKSKGVKSTPGGGGELWKQLRCFDASMLTLRWRWHSSVPDFDLIGP